MTHAWRASPASPFDGADQAIPYWAADPHEKALGKELTLSETEDFAPSRRDARGKELVVWEAVDVVWPAAPNAPTETDVEFLPSSKLHDGETAVWDRLLVKGLQYPDSQEAQTETAGCAR